MLCLSLLSALSPSACSARADDSDRAQLAAERVLPGLRVDLAERGLAVGDEIFIRIFKEERVLELWMRAADAPGFRLFREYPVVAMSGELGPKLREGDRQAPEGFYFVPPSQMNPRSRFHLSFNLGFPNVYDRAHERTGSFLMVHGSNVSIGCFAMTDEKIEEIYTLADAALSGGQKFFRVHIFPFRMTAERTRKARGHKWYDFWRELQPGYDAFEADRVPPDIVVRDKRYAVRIAE
ncbi:MAG: murein L,D-transpeptidase [bacterium]|nr:murein L,D-transpeptidase [bacterium]